MSARYTKYHILYTGFTLVELLVVISIISILASIALVSFRSTQMKGRDAQRKSDLKQMANALELYYSDYGKYPDGTADGKITGCSGNPCTWGTDSFTDGKTVYFKVVPKDPTKGDNYFYRVPDAGANPQKFQIFAHLENTQDSGCIDQNCTAPSVSYSCGQICNFAITSPNTTPKE